MSQQELQSLDLLEVTHTELEKKYSVIAELGHGGMSVVYLGTSRSLGNVQKLVVLKSIKPELLSNDKVRNMFMDEARLAIRLTHPNIVQTYEVAMIDRRPVLVMEYMEGQPLSNLLRKSNEGGGMPLAMRLHVLLGALNGLEHAHNLTDYDGRPLCLVHRDISPQNIFITYDGHVKLLDFGIAKALDRSAHTEFGEIKGKIRYMAPEQMQSSLDLDRRADVFAMGVMLWEFLANRRLWQDAKDIEVMKVVLTQDMPPPRLHAPDIHPQLEAICLKAMQRDPSHRYDSCAAMQADLERVMNELGLHSSERELGKLVQTVFADVRTSIRRAIDRKLKEQDTAPINLRVDERGLLIDDLFTPRTRRIDAGMTPSAVGMTGVTTTSRTKNSRWPYVLLALLLLGGSASAVGLYPRLRGDAPPAVATVAGAVPGSVQRTSNLRVNLRSNPSDAKLFLDGVELPSNPFVRDLPSDGSRHELSAEAEGYNKKSTLIFFSGTEPIDVEVVLEKKGTTHAAKATTMKPAGKAPVLAKPAMKPASAAAAAPDCSYPFYVDETGIRRVRRECM